METTYQLRKKLIAARQHLQACGEQLSEVDAEYRIEGDGYQAFTVSYRQAVSEAWKEVLELEAKLGIERKPVTQVFTPHEDDKDLPF
jgi:hypothetical protein